MTPQAPSTRSKVVPLIALSRNTSRQNVPAITSMDNMNWATHCSIPRCSRFNTSSPHRGIARVKPTISVYPAKATSAPHTDANNQVRAFAPGRVLLHRYCAMISRINEYMQKYSILGE